MQQTIILNRVAAMRLFALAPWPVLDALTKNWADEQHNVLRRPETGLVMLRGRMGSTGNAFNLGEATLTRCSIALPSGTEGHAYIMGRNADHAKRAAICDALHQDDKQIMAPVLSAIEHHLLKTQHTTAEKAAATKVDFFTMVRGDD